MLACLRLMLRAAMLDSLFQLGSLVEFHSRHLLCLFSCSEGRNHKLRSHTAPAYEIGDRYAVNPGRYWETNISYLTSALLLMKASQTKKVTNWQNENGFLRGRTGETQSSASCLFSGGSNWRQHLEAASSNSFPSRQSPAASLREVR